MHFGLCPQKNVTFSNTIKNKTGRLIVFVSTVKEPHLCLEQQIHDNVVLKTKRILSIILKMVPL